MRISLWPTSLLFIAACATGLGAETDIPCSRSFADLPIDLYSRQGEFSQNYTEEVDQLKRGRKIRLPSGRVYTVQGVLDQNKGEASRVVDIGDGWALRIPRRTDDRLQDAIDDFIPLQKELRDAGVKVVDVDLARSEPPYGVVVRKEDFKFEGDHFIALLKQPRQTEVPAEEMERARKALFQFLDQTWAYVKIGDFSPRQIGWNGSEWVLFDFSHGASTWHTPLRNFKQTETVVSTVRLNEGMVQWEERVVSKSIEKKATKRIQKIRAKLSKSGRWFQRQGEGSHPEELVDRITPSPLPKGFKKTWFDASPWNMRYFAGVLPPDRSLEIEVIQLLEEKKNRATYQVLVNGKYPATLSTLVDSTREADQNFLAKLSSKYKKKKEPYLAGRDFVLRYEAAP